MWPYGLRNEAEQVKCIRRILQKNNSLLTTLVKDGATIEDKILR